MSLAWKLRRLSAMNPWEIAFRARQFLQARGESLGIGRARATKPAGTPGRCWVTPLPGHFDRLEYVAGADRILAGNYDLFALRNVRLGFPPRWNRDPKTGIEVPLAFGKTINYRDDSIVGDIKYLWEPNRHLELVTLAQAWHLTREAKYAEGCRTLLRSWIDQCPYPMGPNWTSSLEHGLRLINWSFAWHLLGGMQGVLFNGAGGAEFRAEWLRSVFQHCHFIAGHLSRHSSANNHLLGELAGLFVGATTWPLWPESTAWQRMSHAEFENQALLQTGTDGVNREQATWYHHSVADMMLLAGLVARANSVDFKPAFWDRLQAMIDYIAAIMDVAGNVPRFGDSDDGVAVRFTPSPGFNAFRSLLATGALLFDRADFKRKSAGLDDKTRWLLSDAACARFDLMADTASEPREARAVPSHAFPEGGYYVLGRDLDHPTEIRIVADAGPLGYLGIAAHGHADALSFVLNVAGREMLIDSGTFAYHTQQQWRDYFRGTSAHNTIRIDALDQSVSGGNFLWLRHAQTRCERFSSDAERAVLVAAHDGYMRLADPVLHRRELRLEHAESTLHVTDTLECKGAHSAQWFWHFSEHCSISLHPDHIEVRDADVELDVRIPAGLSCRLVRAGDEEPIGWISRQLDVRTAGVVAIFEGQIRGTSTYQTVIRIKSA